MPADTRLSRMLHVLIHMDHIGAPVTSEAISKMISTNPVVVRRTMAGLKAAGYVTSDKGHGGGWALARSLDEVTLRDIHDALGSPKLFAIGLADDNPRCLVEKAVNAAMDEAMFEAERRLLDRFGEVTIGSLAREVAVARTAEGM
ncbi:Rrf2 family transcriptional regulator [Brevundimonas sp. M20]|jgi:DNA-binding IscR family transcriptional regulator|uniref:RrF2 family transcriptional regulator n=1 Tax=Brevundimonas sp. M20 TaxID=2591463 RepID=UPI001147A14B|nr:Rrf2 family transcriptional regulator [Brevundimonas sp. M20]QDH74584.1 Rrf2 family transcriptional regulator [Brevundimonas sp. M20]